MFTRNFPYLSTFLFNIIFLHKAVELTPPYKYKEKPYEGLLPEINSAGFDRGTIPDKVDKYPKVGQIPKLPPLPSIEEQEGGSCDLSCFCIT